MWYATTRKWIKIEGSYEPIYEISYAQSGDGISWRREAKQLLRPKSKYEVNTRPTVIMINGYYHMWFCYRDVFDFRPGGNGQYKIGYAYSYDMVNWIRDDSLAGIGLSDSGWDSEMMAYPYVLSVGSKIYMFYNGNEFGRYGFGYAELCA